MKNVKRLQACMFLAAFIICNLNIFAQSQAPIIDKQEIIKTVDSLAVKMLNNYVFPDKGKETHDLLKNNLEKRVYDKYTDPMALAQKLTEDILTITNDKHLGVRYAPERIAMVKNDKSSNTNQFEDEQKYMDKKANYDFVEAKVLKGNVGYLKFNAFHNSHEAFETAVGAMMFLQNTDALILDLRDNGGGSPSMIQLLSSYFFAENDEKHLNTFYYRADTEYTYTYTLPYVPGKRRPDWEIYILTSNYTFSAAEEFTYNLKNLERATIIGETTGGGAHPVEEFILTDNFGVRISTGRAINPITKTNWEGVGVKPHYETPRNKALDKAMMLAYENLAEKEESPKYKTVYEWAISDLKAKENPVKLDESTMKSYVGTFGPRTISFENGELIYQREGRKEKKMIPLTETLFMFNDVDYFRLRIIKEGKEVVAIEGIYDNGEVGRNIKTK